MFSKAVVPSMEAFPAGQHLFVRVFIRVAWLPTQNTLFQNGRHFNTFLFTCKLALVASFKGNILLNFEFKNEATRANLQEKKRNFNGGHFGTKAIYKNSSLV